MKRALLVPLFALVFFAPVTLAATLVAEPSLPADIGTYQKKEKSCDKYAGKTLVKITYLKEADGTRKKITVITLNGTKVAQMESSRKSGSTAQLIYYVKNSAGGRWLAHTEREVWNAIELLLAEVGLSQRQFLACGGK